MDDKKFAQQADRYYVNTTQWRVITYDEFQNLYEEYKKRMKTGEDLISFKCSLIPKTIFGEIDSNGYPLDIEKSKERYQLWLNELNKKTKSKNQEQQPVEENQDTILDIPVFMQNRPNNERYINRGSEEYMDATENTNYTQAKRKSNTRDPHVTARSHKKEKVPNKAIEGIKKACIKIGVVPTLVIALTLGSAGTIGVENAIDFLSTNANIIRTEKNISSILYNDDSFFVTRTIISENTHRTEDNQGFYYDNYGIAERLLELPDQMFDASLYCTYELLGPERENDYIDNFGRIVVAVGQQATPEDHAIAYSMCHGCKDKYDMFKNLGITSEEEYITRGRQTVNAKADYISKTADNNGNIDWNNPQTTEIENDEINTDELENQEQMNMGGR